MVRLPGLACDELVHRRVVVPQDGRSGGKTTCGVPTCDFYRRATLCNALAERGERQLPCGGDGDEVAAGPTYERVRGADHGNIGKNGLDGRDLGPNEGVGWKVDDIDGVDAVGSEYTRNLCCHRTRCQMPRHRQPAERVADHQVATARLFLRQPHTSVTHVDFDAGNRLR